MFFYLKKHFWRIRLTLFRKKFCLQIKTSLISEISDTFCRCFYPIYSRFCQILTSQIFNLFFSCFLTYLRGILSDTYIRNCRYIWLLISLTGLWYIRKKHLLKISNFFSKRCLLDKTDAEASVNCATASFDMQKVLL